MLHRLCGSPSIPLSFILANVLPRWNTYCVCDGTEWLCHPTPSIHRLRRGLPGYLILFATHALAHQRQIEPGKLPSLSGFQVISMHFTATSLVPPPSSRLQVNSFNGVLQFSCSLLPLTCRPAYAPFKPNKSG